MEQSAPSELEKGKVSGKSAGGDSVDQPGGNPGATAVLSPSQLGYNGGFMGMFGGIALSPHFAWSWFQTFHTA